MIMPHARIEIVHEVSGTILPAGETGLVRVSGESVFCGYWPAANDSQSFTTADLGRLAAEGRLHIFGRHDSVIITGGEKVMPLEVEATLLKSGAFDDIAVIGLPDATWGQVVVACYPPRAGKLDTQKAEAALQALAPYKRPKKFVAISPWPRNAQGKIQRSALLDALKGRQPA